MFAVAMVRRALMAKVKLSTGSGRLEAVANGTEALKEAYLKTLNDLRWIPADDPYRKSVEAYVGHRLRIVQQERDWEAVQNRLGVGQIEDLLDEARWQHFQILGVIKEEPWVQDCWKKVASKYKYKWDINSFIYGDEF